MAPDAEKAYKGFLEFKDVVEKNQVTAASAPATVPSGDKIGAAAKALSDASYPFIKDVDWLSDVYLKPLPGKTAPETLKAIDQMIATRPQFAAIWKLWEEHCERESCCMLWQLR